MNADLLTDAQLDELVHDAGTKCLQIAGLLSRIEQRLPAVHYSLVIYATELIEHVHTARKNDVGGRNAIPHYMAALDSIIDDLCTLEGIRRY
jgi:hypothetical protein